MNWKCDLYCYYDASGGITTHVAGRRIVGDVLEVPDLTVGNVASGEWLKLHQEQMKFLETAQRKPIELPEVGESFNDSDIESFRERLTYLRGLGYNFPDYLFEIE